MGAVYLCSVNLRDGICAPTRKKLRVHGGAGKRVEKETREKAGRRGRM